MNLVYLLLSLLLMTACNNKIIVERPDKPTLKWNYPSPIIRSGETIPFAFLNGVPGYTTDANGIGVLDPTTFEFTAPSNQSPILHTIFAEDSLGMQGSNELKIAGFGAGNQITFPLSFGEMNTANDAAITASDDMFVVSSAYNTNSYMQWIVWKSTDDGATFTKVDQYALNIEGEAHPISVTTKNNDVYVCGKVADWNTGSGYFAWVTRKSSDGGLTWSTIDMYGGLIGNAQCSEIVKGPSGNLIAVGKDQNGGIIRESTDDGQSWSTIYSAATVNGNFFAAAVTGTGVVWVISKGGDVYKGSYASGWTFNLAGNLGAVDGAYGGGTYEVRGRLVIINTNKALYSYTESNVWKIKMTIDGGANWTTQYNAGANSYGGAIIELSNNDLLSIGQINSSPDNLRVVRSQDGGTTWAATYSASPFMGSTLVEANDGSFVRAFGRYRSRPGQVVNLVSTDSGFTFNFGSPIIFRQQLYDRLEGIATDSLGNTFATGGISFIDSNYTEPWVVLKTSNAGSSWTNSDVFTDATADHFMDCLSIGPNDEIYVGGRRGTTNIVRRSTDHGVSWTQVDSSVIECALMTVAPNGDVFFMRNLTNASIRKGGSNGTVWSTLAQTLPVAAGATSWFARDLKASPDGSLWRVVSESGGGVNDLVVSRSVDNGVNFTEVLREAGGSGGKITFGPDGAAYLVNPTGKVIKSSDTGVTWTQVYDGSFGFVSEVNFDRSGRIYMLNDYWIIGLNQFTGLPFLIHDYSLDHPSVPNGYLWVETLVKCQGTSGLCMVTHYDDVIKGSVHELIPLVIP